MQVNRFVWMQGIQICKAFINISNNKNNNNKTSEIGKNFLIKFQFPL